MKSSARTTASSPSPTPKAPKAPRCPQLTQQPRLPDRKFQEPDKPKKALIVKKLPADPALPAQKKESAPEACPKEVSADRVRGDAGGYLVANQFMLIPKICDKKNGRRR